jgi:Flp pilus assembly protein TadB
VSAAGALERIRWLSPAVRADLAVTATPVETYAAAKTTATVAGLVVPVLATALATLAGADLGLVPVWVALCAAGIGFTVADLRLRRAARAARRDARTALSAYLDLVALALASGAGLVEALFGAARIGDGRLFDGLRGALAGARPDGLSPAAALARLGRELALPELADTAARLTLVEGGGAQAAASLHAQAATLRDAEVSDARGAANERSQSLLVAQVLLGLAFLIFLTYPALVRVATL